MSSQWLDTKLKKKKTGEYQLFKGQKEEVPVKETEE